MSYMMTVDEYEQYLSKQVGEFFRVWREKMKLEKSDSCPPVLHGKDRSQAIIEWEEQFAAWQEVTLESF